MNIKFENLEKIDEVLLKLNQLNSKVSSPKRWFNIDELAVYTGYSVKYLRTLKDQEFIENKHFYKKKGKLLFDKDMIDEWITSSKDRLDANEIATNILEGLI